ncbi:MAG: DUF1018 domain-containing protein [Sinobacteraceae bacterium]|nr:DUF1018 domain-containing protein [Nevskiaceae bacterium]
MTPYLDSPTAPSGPKQAQEWRRRDLARIHILADELGMTREQYEAVLWAVARVTSAAQLDEYGRRRVIGHLKARLPWAPGRPRPMSIGEIASARMLLREAERRARGIPLTLEQRPLLQKIGALLADARRPWKYAQALAKRIAGKDRLELCSDAELRKIVAALAIDQQRRRRRAEATA